MADLPKQLYSVMMANGVLAFVETHRNLPSLIQALNNGAWVEDTTHHWLNPKQVLWISYAELHP